MGVRGVPGAAAMTTIAMFVSGSSSVRGAFVAGPIAMPLVSQHMRGVATTARLRSSSFLPVGASRGPLVAAGSAGGLMRRGGVSTASFATMQSSNRFELEGRLKKVMDVQTFASGFTKREFILTTNEMYPQDIKFELVKDKTALIDRFGIDSPIKVSFNIRGNAWQDKYFVNLQAWRIEEGGGEDDFAGAMGAGSGWDTPASGGGKAPEPEVKAAFNDLQGGWDNVAPKDTATTPVAPEPKAKTWDEDVQF